MPDFDAHAYARTVDIFTKAQDARKSLPSLVEQIRDSVDMLSAVQIDGMPKGSSSENPQETRLISHIGLLELMENRQREYEQIVADAERVIENMEDFGDGSGYDAAFLRYVYLQGMTQQAACKKIGYSESYYKEKNSIALVHASFAVTRLGM